jgi:aminopeptidase N
MVVPPALIDLFAMLLEEEHQDYFFIAEMLALPSENYIGEQMNVIDVTAIHAARELVLTQIADQLQELFFATYQKYHDASGSYQFNMYEVGKRQLKNRCLSYLMQLPQYTEIGWQQFETSLEKNMTDTQASLVALANLESPKRQVALDRFYEVWQHDALVVDKWLSIQAASKLPQTLQTVRKLTRHMAFDLKNPNKVFALIGTFGHHNQANFHAETGEGYAFLREMVTQLDQLNPQVASRMIKPLTLWHRYNQGKSALMQAQLKQCLQNKKISNDLYELVTKSLSEG